MHRETTLSSRQRWRGRRSAALLLLVAGMTLAGIYTGRSAHANPNQMIGLDMTPASGDTPVAAGVNTCVEVAVGDSFEADVFATNVSSLTAYEFRVDFDPKILTLDSESIDFNFLLAKDGGSAGFPQVDMEKPGRWFIGAADGRFPDSGSGTLARLRFNTLKAGTSAISIASSPVFYGPRLTGALGAWVGDDNGDGIWDGGLSSGKVAVGASCAGATPIVTPAPTQVPNTTPKPGSSSSTPVPTGSRGPNSGDGGSGDGAGGPGVEPTDTSPEIAGNVDSGGGLSSPTRAPGSVQNPGDVSGNGGGGPNQNDSGGSSNLPTIVLIALGAALVAAAGAVLLWLRMAAAREYPG